MGICQGKTEDQPKPKPIAVPSEKTPLGADKLKPIKEIGIKDNSCKEINIPVPIDVTFKTMKSICKITVKHNGFIGFGTGFFMKISEAEKYLITNNHVISQGKINWDI